ncbi:MAG: hypothetical protein Q9184_008278 [Pyrenodesmia sp. 2 TL-2023]
MSESRSRSVSKTEDEGKLAELGYTQELRRDWGLLHNFGASFSIIRSSSGPAWQRLFQPYRRQVDRTSGPICSQLKDKAHSSLGLLDGEPLGVLRGVWQAEHMYRFNLIGQVAVTTGIDFGLAHLISTTAAVSNGYRPTAGKTLGILALILLSHVVVNMMSIRKLRYMIYTSVALNIVGILSMIIAILAKARTHQPASFVFGKFYDGTGVDGGPGWSVRASPAYVAVTGILMSQFTILGFDASAHLCEETRKAVRDAPLGMVSAIGGAAVIGFVVIIGLLFSIQDFDAVRQSPLPVLKILIDTCGQSGGLVLMVLIMLCVWHCGLFSLVCTVPAL